ncbi:hypothetical protein J3E69DRAFT_307503 [Trichoderma sp. SZMC 28015]
MPHTTNNWNRITDYRHSRNRQTILALTNVLLILPVVQAAKYSSESHNWQAAFFSQALDKPPIAKKQGPPGEKDERIPLVVTNKCDSTIWPGVATQSGTGPGIGGFELAANKTRKL